MAQCLGDPLSLSLAVGQQLLRLVLDRSSQRPDLRGALFCSLIANGPKRLKQVRIFGDQRESQRLVRECDLIA